MLKTFDSELAELRRGLVAMGGMVERATAQSVDAILAPVAEARERAHQLDDQLDAMHEDLENRLHRLLALQTPKVGDLRLVVSSLRIIALFEQMGDLAEGVSRRAAFIARHHLVDNPTQVAELGRLVVTMIREGVESYVSGSIELARRIVSDESRSDELTKACYADLQQAMAAHPELIREFTHLLRAVANLEHIGDLAMMIAEEAVFIHQGRSVRHHPESI